MVSKKKRQRSAQARVRSRVTVQASADPKPTDAQARPTEVPPQPAALSVPPPIPPGFGRIPVHNVQPVLEGGDYAAKAVENGDLPVTANIFREGHDAVAAAVVLTDPAGATQRFEMAQIEPIGLDIWKAWIRVGRPGDYSFHIEAYDDRWGTWRHNAGIKFSVGQDIALVCLEGLQLLDEARDAARAAGDDAAVTLLE